MDVNCVMPNTAGCSGFYFIIVTVRHMAGFILLK